MQRYHNGKFPNQIYAKKVRKGQLYRDSENHEKKLQEQELCQIVPLYYQQKIQFTIKLYLLLTVFE